MKLSLFTDGGSRGNPGPAAIGVVVVKYKADHSGVELRIESEEIACRARCIGRATNNVAEYHALIDGLQMCKELGATEVECFSDSQLLVNQMDGSWKVKKRHLRTLRDKAIQMTAQFERVSFVWFERNHPWIQRADELLNKELDK